MEVNAIKAEDEQGRRLRFPSTVDDTESLGDTVSIPVESLKNSSENGKLYIYYKDWFYYKIRNLD